MAIENLKSLTVQCNPDTLDLYNELFEQSGISTKYQFFEAIVQRYALPQKVEDRTKELQQQLDDLKAKLEASEQAASELKERLTEVEGERNSNAEAANLSQMAHEEEVASLRQQIEDGTLGENQRVISFIPENLRALELVSERESKRRNQDWTISHVVNFFIHSRFVCGNLNGDLGSLSDSELKKAGIKIVKKQNFEL